MIKLKTLLEDTDQNNNGYPDSTEGNLGRANVDTYYTKPPTGFQFTNKPIDSQANKLLMNYWDNILNSQEKQQEYQDDRKAGNSNWRDGIELYNRYIITAGRAENQLKVSGYITPTMRTSDEGSANSLMILFSGTDNFMDRIAVNVFKKYGFDKTSINRSYDPNDGIVEFKVALSNEIADKISNELERADRGLGAYGGYIIIKK